MRALRYDTALTLDTRHADPTPGADECLVRVRMAGASSADLLITAGETGFRGVLGHEFVGVVERGSGKWQGRRVVGEINCVCRSCDMCLSGLSNHCRKRTVIGMHGRDGCFADFVSLPVRNLHGVPDALTDEEAVFAQPVASALQVLAQCSIDRRMHVTIVGPGLMGLLVMQVLRPSGCRLDVVGRHQHELDFCDKKGVQGIPADECLPQHDRDVVIDCTESVEGLALAARLVRPRGTILLKGYGLPGARQPRTETGLIRGQDTQPAVPMDLSLLIANEVTVMGSRCGSYAQAIDALARGAIDVSSMVSRVFDFDDAIAALKSAASPGVLKTLLRMNA